MQIKDIDELENQFNEVAGSLDSIESLSKILLDCIYQNSDLKPKDVQNLTDVLNEKIIELKEKFALIAQSFII